MIYNTRYLPENFEQHRLEKTILRYFPYTQCCRIKGCGGAGCLPPPPIIFQRLKLSQQIIHRRKGNLSESPNHKKYWENILISRFYEQFSRSSRILGHFWKFEKISNSKNTNILYIILKRVIWRFQIYNFKFRGFTKAFKNFAKYTIAFTLLEI